MARMVLNHIDPVSFAKLYAAMVTVIMFVFCLLYALIVIVFGSMMGEAAVGIGLAIAIAIFLPLIYAVFTFVLSLLIAWIFNTVAERVGGVEMEFDDVS